MSSARPRRIYSSPRTVCQPSAAAPYTSPPRACTVFRRTEISTSHSLPPVPKLRCFSQFCETRLLFFLLPARSPASFTLELVDNLTARCQKCVQLRRDAVHFPCGVSGASFSSCRIFIEFSTRTSSRDPPPKKRDPQEVMPLHA